MRVAFDAQLLMKGEKTGIGWCTENILIELGKVENFEKQLNCFTMGYSEKGKESVYKYQKFGYEIQKCSWFHDVVYRCMWNIIPVPYFIFFNKKVDVTIFFNYIIPPGVRGKKVAVIHDMAYKSCPKTVRKRTKIFLEASLGNTCKRADKIITVSEFSKKEILKYFPIAEGKIEVVPLGVDFNRFHINYTEEEKEQVKKKYHLGKEYFLYIGTIEPRKNLEKLIRAYFLLLKRKNNIPELVIIGCKGWMYKSIFQTVEDLKLKDKVYFVGYIQEEELACLLNGAKAFLFPSLYEGFGLPLLEAMASGVPVVTSKISSMPEVAGDAAILVEPDSVESIYEGLEEVLEEAVAKRMICKGLERVKNYTWERTAEKYLEICTELIKNKSERGK